MKKFIVAIDGLKYSESATKYAVELAKLSEAHLVGVFLEDFSYHSYKIYELIGDEGISEQKRNRLEGNDEQSRSEAVHHFETACQRAGLNYSVHHDKSIAIQELLHESAYADMLIIDSKETLTHYPENIPTRFIRDLLPEVECPVLLVPAKYVPVKKTILLYDGDPSSVYAIKMFSYLFPTLSHGDSEVISVKSMNETSHVPDNKLIKEFMKRHFPKALYTILKGVPETAIVRYIKEHNEKPIIVSGSYRRGMLSRWLRASLADTLMKELQLPLFIAHNK